MKMRIPCSRKTLARGSCVLAGITLVLGCTALFSSHWVESGNIHAGFYAGCSGGFCSSTLDNIPGDYRTAYGVAMTTFILLPLMLIFASFVLQAITVWRGPSKHRDVAGLVCVWLSGYHSLLLTVLLITAASLIPSPPDTDTETASQNRGMWTTTTTISNGFADVDYVMESDSSSYNSAGQFQMEAWNVGWSAYFGLLATIMALVSAISSSLYFGKAENEESDDVIPLQPNAI